MRELKMGVKAREWDMELVVTIALKYSECQVKPRIHSTHSLLPTPTHPHYLTLSLSHTPHSPTRSLAHSLSRSLAHSLSHPRLAE